MIKTGIAGAYDSIAGELLRILVHHPDIDLLQVVDSRAANRSASAVHHGLIGETVPDFTDNLQPEKLDTLFICPGSEINYNDLLTNPENQELRVIDLSGKLNEIPESTAAVSEIYRKPMVRGLKRATVMHPVASIGLVSLFPLATHLILNGDMSIDVNGPENITTSDSLDFAKNQINRHLSLIQNSFDSEIKISGISTGHNRSTTVKITLPCKIQLDEVLKIYENIYDDHNFTFMTLNPVGTQEVSGTQKCIITIEKPDSETLRLTTIADCRMRGGAGDAVHALNLLFGLHERTGLSLKAAKY